MARVVPDRRFWLSLGIVFSLGCAAGSLDVESWRGAWWVT